MFDITHPPRKKKILAIDSASAFLKELASQLDTLVRAKLWLQIVIGLMLGIVVGAILGPDLGWVAPENATIAGSWLALPGKLFLNLIGMVVSMLVMASIITGLNKSTSGEQLRTIGSKFSVFVVVTTAFAVAIGMALALAIQPGSYIVKETQEQEIETVPREIEVEVEGAPEDEIPSPERSVPKMISDLIPQKPIASLAEGEMLGIVVFAILLGIATTTANREKIKPFLDLMEAIMEVSMVVIKWAMFLAPWAVFGLMAQLIARVGLDTIIGMGVYVLTVVAGLAGVLVLYLLMVTIMGGIGLKDFLSRVGPVQLLAFSTSSTAAVMPLSIKTAVEKLKVPESTAGLVIPLAATVNMAGTALYQGVAIIFLAQMAGVQLSLGELTLIVVTLVASSIGAPGTPGVGLVILGNIAGDFGIPTDGLVLILGVDRILDMTRTAVNVTGDLTACVLLGKSAPISERLSPVELTPAEAETAPI